MNLNLNNIEELVFYDTKIHKLLPEFKHIFDKWRLAQMTSGLRQMGKDAVLELLNSIEDEHKRLLEGYFNTSLTIDKLDHHLVKNVEAPLDAIVEELEGLEEYPNLCAYRDGEQVYVCVWR